MKRKNKRGREVPPLAVREAETAKKREEERERRRAEKFRLSRENNPYDQIESARPRRRRDKILLFPGKVQVFVSQDAVYQKSVQSIKSFPWKKLTVTFALIFFGGIGSAWFQAEHRNIQRDIDRAKITLRDLNKENDIREAERRERYTFDEIERIATERLGMSFPDASQVIYINVPRIGGVTLNTDEHVLPKHNYFFEDVSNFLSGLSNRVFGGD